MPWVIEYTDEFEEWWFSLNREQKIAVDDRIELLERDGPHLRRPVIGLIESSRFENMKELICNEGGSLRVLFMFDPRRAAILLLGGNKEGEWEEWYLENVPKADAIYEQYLGELKKEGLL